MAKPSHAIDPAVRKIIDAQLEELERKHDIRILYACESGSRGWGFASRDSDYDVRFVYVHRLAWYLQVRREAASREDVIIQPVNGELDINGWELNKALSLFKGGNSTYVEWMDSPVCYRNNPSFTPRMRKLIKGLHQPRHAYYHYLRMTQKNFKVFEESPRPTAKQFLYALRPVLSVKWVELALGPVPMRFEVICSRILKSRTHLSAVDRLLEAKRQADEKDPGTPHPVLVSYVRNELLRLKHSTFEDHRSPDFSPLDDLLFDMVTGFEADRGSR
jgi:predicted nucleotidyltransferase